MEPADSLGELKNKARNLTFFKVMILVIFALLILSLFKTESTVMKSKSYACNKTVYNTKHDEYYSNRDSYMATCAGKAYYNYYEDEEAEYKLTECESAYDEKHPNIPDEYVTQSTKCTHYYNIKCIAFFGKCFYELQETFTPLPELDNINGEDPYQDPLDSENFITGYPSP